MNLYFFSCINQFIVIYGLVIFLLLHNSISSLCLALPLAFICFRFIVREALQETLRAWQQPRITTQL